MDLMVGLLVVVSGLVAQPRPAACPGVIPIRPPLVALDDASMRAAVIASYTGIYGHPPSGLPGSGAEDVGYWIAISNHYGEFSDHVCRAGWSKYWEEKLRGSDSVNPALGDQPAQFQPVPTTTPPPTPAGLQPEPTSDLAAVSAKLDAMLSQIEQLRQQQAADTDRIETRINEVVAGAKKSAAPLILKILSLGLAK
jgi:hypothetical protein